MGNDNTKLQYIVELLTQGDTKKAVDELNKLNKSADGVGKGMASALTGSKQLFAFLGGSALIVDALNKFTEAERGINALNAALIQTGNDAPGALAAVKELADSLGNDLKVQADDVIKVMTQLITFGANPKDLRRLTETVYDLSEVMGRDVGRAARQMSQALRGNFEVFNTLGIEVDKTKTSTEGFNEAFDKMVAMINGRARKAVQGVAGDVQGLKVTLEDAKQQLGKWEADVLTAVAAVAENLADAMTRPELENSITRQKDAYGVLADAIARAVLQAEKLGKITKEEAGRLFGKVGAARQILHGGLTDFGQTTSDEDLRAIQEMRLPQARGFLSSVQTRLGLSQNSPSASSAAPAGPGQIGTPGLDDKDFEEIIEHWNELAEVEQKLAADQLESRQLVARVAEEQINEEIEAYENGERIKQDLIDQTVLVMLEGDARVRAEMEITHEQRIEAINQEKFETQEQKDSAMRTEALLFEEEKKRFALTRSFSYKLNQDMKQIGEAGQEAFASGLAGAMINAFEEGDKAFQKFAANFMRQMADMILQALILRAVQGIAGSFSGGGGGVSGGVSGSGAAYAGQAAAGGQFVNAFAAGGMAGVSSLDRATYFPKFNVLAGEAGREIVTVLARPSFERINGVPAQIGYAGGNRLAITSADALAGAGGGGMGGSAVLRVELAPGLVASIKDDSIKGARLMIVQDMSTDSQLSRVTRQKMA